MMDVMEYDCVVIAMYGRSFSLQHCLEEPRRWECVRLSREVTNKNVSFNRFGCVLFCFLLLCGWCDCDEE